MKKSYGFLLSLGLAFSLTSNASAVTTDTTTAQVSVNGGNLALIKPTASVDFGAVTIDGTVKTLNIGLGTLQLSDLRGTGQGWHVNVGATPFTQSGGAPTPLSLPTNTLTMNGIGTITQTSGSSGLPTGTAGAPWTIDTGSVTILSAAVGAGMGEFDVALPANALTLTIDTTGNIYDPAFSPTVYESTITWDISTGP